MIQAAATLKLSRKCRDDHERRPPAAAGVGGLPWPRRAGVAARRLGNGQGPVPPALQSYVTSRQSVRGVAVV